MHFILQFIQYELVNIWAAKYLSNQSKTSGAWHDQCPQCPAWSLWISEWRVSCHYLPSYTLHHCTACCLVLVNHAEPGSGATGEREGLYESSVHWHSLVTRSPIGHSCIKLACDWLYHWHHPAIQTVSLQSEQDRVILELPAGLIRRLLLCLFICHTQCLKHS